MTRHWVGSAGNVFLRCTSLAALAAAGAMILPNVRTFWHIGAGIVPRANHRLPKFYRCISSKYPRSHWYQRFDGGVTVLLSLYIHRNNQEAQWWRGARQCYTLGATERTNEHPEQSSDYSEKFHRNFSLQCLWNFLWCVLSVFYVSLR